MRFSSKWLLALTAYVALFAASLADDTARFANLLWTITLAAFCCALLVALIGGARRWPACGFVVFFSANLICLYTVPDRVPSSQVVTLVYYPVSTVGNILVPTGKTLPGGDPEHIYAERQVMRATNAAGTMAAGLVGLVVSGYVCRTSERSAANGPKPELP